MLKDHQFRRYVKDLDQIEFVMQSIGASNAIAYTQQLARDEAELAKQAFKLLPDSDYCQALAELADYSVARTH